MDLRCTQCSQAATGALCTACGGLTEFVLGPIRLDPAGYKHLVASRRGATGALAQSGVWRFLELLPPLAARDVVTLGENNVPLYESARGARYAGVDRLSYLHLGMNPTGSFKDAGMTVAVSAAKAAGARAVVCASTGNTASSMAAYAARAGLVALVAVPAGGVSRAKLAQMRDYGACIVPVEGSFDLAMERVRALAREDVAVVNSLNPYRIEGQKCAAFRLLEERGWEPPDWVVLPGGNLGNASAFGKGFREALALGFIDRLPRLAVAQASGAAPFVRAYEGAEELVPVDARTAAGAIAIGAPVSWRKARRELAAVNGAAVAVSDEAIALAKAAIGREGIGCEPASAAALAGARALREAARLRREDDVVVVLTGHALKDGEFAQRFEQVTQRAWDDEQERELRSLLQGERAPAI